MNSIWKRSNSTTKFLFIQNYDYQRLYCFDNYRVLKFTTSDEIYFKVFGEVLSRFDTGNSWRLNSGITKVVYNKRNIAFFGYTGSVYVLPLESQEICTYHQPVLDEILSYKDVELLENSVLFDVLREHNVEVIFVEDDV